VNMSQDAPKVFLYIQIIPSKPSFNSGRHIYLYNKKF